jgi:hypothetical protein
MSFEMGEQHLNFLTQSPRGAAGSGSRVLNNGLRQRIGRVDE